MQLIGEKYKVDEKPNTSWLANKLKNRRKRRKRRERRAWARICI